MLADESLLSDFAPAQEDEIEARASQVEIRRKTPAAASLSATPCPRHFALAGRLLQLSCDVGPIHSGAQVAFADWCFARAQQHARHVLKHGPKEALTPSEMQHIAQALHDTAATSGSHFPGSRQPSSAAQGIRSVAPALHGLQSTVAEVLGQHQFDAEAQIFRHSPAEQDFASRPYQAARQALEAALPTARPSVISRLLQLWLSIHKRHHYFYQLSTEAYFRGLRLGEAQAEGTALLSPASAATMAARMLHCALRVLWLLSHHHDSLLPTVRENLDTTPLSVWYAVVPQLFARLGTPEAAVREQVQQLLCELAGRRPDLVLYGAVVGARNVQAGVAHASFEAVRSAVHQSAAALVSALEALIVEAERISVLWEEQWLELVSQKQVEVLRRIPRLQSEAQRLQQNLDLSPEDKVRLMQQKHEAILRPTVEALTALKQLTYGSGEQQSSRHEQWFHATFGALIETTLRHLSSGEVAMNATAKLRGGRPLTAVPLSLAYSPQLACAPLSRLEDALRQATLQRTHVSLEEVSPALARWQNSNIPMPGVLEANAGNGAAQAHQKDAAEERPSTGSSKVAGSPVALATSAEVCIMRFDPSITVLGTKTRPKKMTLWGSDGRAYTYLLKGHDDLHLDERIMQVLSAVNTVLRRHRPHVRVAPQILQARNYHVVPLGRRSGLIQWVNGAQPVYRLFRSWQQWTYAAQRQAYEAALQKRAAAMSAVHADGESQRQRPAPATEQEVLREPAQPVKPSVLFYNALHTAFRDSQVSSSLPRAQWPLDVLIAVSAVMVEVGKKKEEKKEKAGKEKRRTNLVFSYANSMLSFILR